MHVPINLYTVTIICSYIMFNTLHSMVFCDCSYDFETKQGNMHVCNVGTQVEWIKTWRNHFACLVCSLEDPLLAPPKCIIMSTQNHVTVYMKFTNFIQCHVFFLIYNFINFSTQVIKGPWYQHLLASIGLAVYIAIISFFVSSMNFHHAL